MRKLDTTKLNELTDEDIEQYVIEFEAAMENPATLTVEEIKQGSEVLSAVIRSTNEKRFSAEIIFKCTMLRHTVNNELAPKRLARSRR